MPLPVSATVIATKSPLRPSRVSAGCSVAFSAESVIMPPSGMASRALSARLMSASSNSARSTRTGHSSGGTTAASRTCAPIELAISGRTASRRSPTPATTGVSIWRRENDSSCRVSNSPRRAASSIASAARTPF